MKLDVNILSGLRREYGEAFYLLDSVQFKKNFLELKYEFSKIYSDFNIAYSYKTNYIPQICRIVNELGGYAEVVSEMETELAFKIGVEPQKIIWNGPIKNPQVLQWFLERGGTVNIDSIDEYKIIKEIVSKHSNHIYNIGIRCNFDVNDGVLSRFGIDIDSEEFQEVLAFTQNAANVKLINLQCHFAKRQIDYWPARVKGMLELIDRIGVIPERIDLGGGLFGKMEDSLKKQFRTNIPEYKDYAKVVATMFEKKFKNLNNRPELMLEPGSALIGDCMKFVGTIKTIKSIRGKTIVSVLGSQKNISMSNINPPIQIFAMGNTQHKFENVDFVGFTCIESDILYRNYTGNLAIGDMMVISNCGSYSLVMKPPFILPNFPVLDVSEGDVEVIKNGETFKDIFNTFNF
ncbi:hypothetical protein C818_02942 [Lachnospiraceae bacterium MD308]|nr:hypothetical protein C818_02942 [Lachnospiraceae bacterium MD308]MCI8504502.1 pyridoxal-dependent decarboxylase [Dorea sp.]